MPKVRIADIIAVFRDVKVPEKCPNCGSPLRNEEDLNNPAVRRYDYVLYYTKGQLSKEGDDKITVPWKGEDRQRFEVEGGLSLSAYDRLGEFPESSADNDIPGFIYFCENCDEIIAGTGDVHQVENIIPCADFVPDMLEKQSWNLHDMEAMAIHFIDEHGLGEFFWGYLEEVARKENGK
jgi:hypothetical protein